MEQRTTIDGHIVSYDSDLHDGMYYFLRQLNEQERKVFFDEAYRKKTATFEDHMGQMYKLTHQPYGYQLIKD